MNTLSWLKGVDLDKLRSHCCRFPEFFDLIEQVLKGEVSLENLVYGFPNSLGYLKEGFTIPFREIPLCMDPLQPYIFYGALKYRLEVGE